MSRLFNKLTTGGHRLFSKISKEAPRLMGKLSNGLHTASGYIDKGLNFVDKHKQILDYLPTEISAPARGLIQSAKIGNNLLKQGSNITNPNSYHGNIGEIGRDALQRAMKIKEDSEDLVKFH
jgi:hypothetical protein